jgi:hypothetical protein
MAGSQNGSFKTISQLAELVAPTGKPLRQRTTDYGQPSEERRAAAAPATGCARRSAGRRTAAAAGRVAPAADGRGIAALREPAALQQEVPRSGRPLGRLAAGVAHAHRAHRLPARGQAQRPGRDRLAEQRAGHPARAQALHGQRDQQVLHRGAHRDQEHGPLRGVAARVRVGVRGVGHQARHDDQRRPAERLAAAHPAGDLLLGEPVPAQVLLPGREHVVEQPGPRRGRLHHREPPRRAVMRRGRGQRRRDGPADRLRRDRLGGELLTVRRAYSTSARRAGTCPLRGPDQGRRAGPSPSVTSPASPARSPPAPARSCPAPGQPPASSSATAATVTSSGLAERVPLAPVVAQRESPGADRAVGLAVAPRAAHRVGDHHATCAGPLPQPGAQPPGRAVRILRQQHDGARLRVRLVRSRGQHRPCRVCAIVVGPRRVTTRTVSASIASSRPPGRPDLLIC